MKNIKKNKTKRYAFWSYDLCPYVVGGSFSGPIKDRYVYPDGHQGFGFKPIKIIKGDKGKETLNIIKQLTTEYNRESLKLKEIYRNKVEELLK